MLYSQSIGLYIQSKAYLRGFYKKKNLLSTTYVSEFYIFKTNMIQNVNAVKANLFGYVLFRKGLRLE